MYDVFGNIDKSRNNFVFYSIGGTSTWQTWIKPRGCKIVSITVIGGGGGGGTSGAGTLNSSTGGGGGGSSSITTGIFPADLLPNQLYIQVGLGGTAGIAGAGGAGGLSYVSALPSTTAINVILASGAAAAGGGGAGGTSIQGTAGAAGTIFSQAGRPYSYLGVINNVAGQIGGIGGSITPSAGGSITPVLPISAGAGGGGLDLSSNAASGGTIQGGGYLPVLAGGPVVGASNYIRSAGGYNIYCNFNGNSRVPFSSLGGYGGGASYASTAGSGGDGGHAGIGSGGGGGGACNTASGNGFGGIGGGGIVIIVCS